MFGKIVLFPCLENSRFPNKFHTKSLQNSNREICQFFQCMKVLEPIHLHTAGSVQACQHLLDLFTCRSHVLLSVQSPTEAVRCTFPKHSLSKPQGFIDRRQHYHCWTTGIHSRVPSSAGGRKEKPGPSLSSLDALLWCLRTYLLTIQLSAKWPPMKVMWPT